MSELTVIREELRRLQGDVRRIKAGELPTDNLVIGTGQGNAIRVSARRGPRMAGDLVAHPYLEYGLDADGNPSWRRSADGVAVDELATVLATTPQSYPDEETPAVGGGGTGGLQDRFLNPFNIVSNYSQGLTTSWAEESLHGTPTRALLQGALIPLAGSHRISLYASTDTDGASVRLYDVTNSNVLWTVTGIDTSAGFHETTTVANLPTADARCRIEAQSTAGTPTLTLGWLSWWAIV